MDGITIGAGLLGNSATIKDAVNNNASLLLNSIAPTTNIFVNTVHPTVTLSTTAAATVNAPFYGEYSIQRIRNRLAAADFTLSNATASEPQTTDNTSYALSITPTADGAVGILLPADCSCEYWQQW